MLWTTAKEGRVVVNGGRREEGGGGLVRRPILSAHGPTKVGALTLKVGQQ